MRRMSLVTAAVLVSGAIASPPIVSAQATKAPGVPVRPGGATVQGFSVVLLLGDLQGGTTADNVPPAARKALGDIKDFLPYKSYRLLDTAWTLASNNGVRSALRLRGLENQEFELSLNGGPAATPGAPARLNLSFALSDGGSDVPAADAERSGSRLNEQRSSGPSRSGTTQFVADFAARVAGLDRDIQTLERTVEALAERPEQQKDALMRLAKLREERLELGKQLVAARDRLKTLQSEQLAAVPRIQQDLETRKMQLADLEARRKALEDTLQSLRSRYTATHPQVVQAQSELDRLSLQVAAAREGARQSSGPGRRIIDTSFSMDVGETVVVGTSRLGGGDKAIIAVLTAVARAR